MEKLKRNPTSVSTSDHLFFGCAIICLAMAFLLVFLLVRLFSVHEIDRHSSPDNKYTLIVQKPGWKQETKINVEDPNGKTLHTIENLLPFEVGVKWLLEENTVIFKEGKGLNLQTGEIITSPLFELGPIDLTDAKQTKLEKLETLKKAPPYWVKGYLCYNLKEVKQAIGKRKYTTEPSWLLDLEKNRTQKECFNEPISTDLKTFSVETGEHFVEMFPDFFVYYSDKSDWLEEHNIVVETMENNGESYLQTMYREETLINDYLATHQPKKLDWSNEKYHCYQVCEESVLACVYNQGEFCHAKIYPARSLYRSGPFLIEALKKRVLAHTEASKKK